ncbi:50S ribosomal protein L23 [Candidatus Woesearchaeota archaeon CG07_land_8_20_14_0_80_44_23]|nr:MAG: 50S ribosomal protein L23 [Candidatus Woesearchaeota archaeon CG07_land_8_20_14_0_80_44_23]
METSKVIKYPVSNEKTIKMMESENKLIFVVDRAARKADVKKAVEEAFKVKVIDVNFLNDMKGNKKAYVRLSGDTPAIDIATQLGMM